MFKAYYYRSLKIDPSAAGSGIIERRDIKASSEHSISSFSWKTSELNEQQFVRNIPVQTEANFTFQSADYVRKHSTNPTPACTIYKYIAVSIRIHCRYNIKGKKSFFQPPFQSDRSAIVANRTKVGTKVWTMNHTCIRSRRESMDMQHHHSPSLPPIVDRLEI